MLMTLTKCEEDYAAAVASCGVLETLVRQLQQPDCLEPAVTLPAVLDALAALSHGSALRSAAIEAAGAIPAVVHCLRRSEPAVQFRSAQLLGSLSHSCPRLRASILEAGGAEGLQQLASSTGDDKIRQLAEYALSSLAQAEQQQGTAEQHGAAASGEAESTPVGPARPPRVCAAPGCGATRGLQPRALAGAQGRVPARAGRGGGSGAIQCLI